MKMPQEYTEDHIRHHTLTRRAHLEEKIGVPHKMHEWIRFRAHLSACQRKIESGEVNQGGSRLPRSAELGRHPVEVHFEED